MVASQEFRDGVASGAAALAVRLRAVSSWGVTLNDQLIDQMAESIRAEAGGTVFIDGEARR